MVLFLRIYIGEPTVKYDSKKYIWNNMYFLAYKNNIAASLDEQFKLKNSRWEFYTEFRYNEKTSHNMNFSGDIIFNFIPDPQEKRGKRRLSSEMSNILNMEMEKAQKEGDCQQISKIMSAFDLLRECQMKTERKVNVSLLPCRGSLQTVKQAVGRDRPDTFIWCVDQHYNGYSLLLNHCAAAYLDDLKSFLGVFKSVYEFCHAIYHIEDKNFVDELINSGSKPIDSAQRVFEYLILAKKFWHKRGVYFTENTLIRDPFDKW